MNPIVHFDISGPDEPRQRRFYADTPSAVAERWYAEADDLFGAS